MTDILQIDGWLPTKTHETATERTIEATYTTPATTCQKCGVIGGGLYKHGTKEASFRDTPMFGKHVTIKGTIQRYRCRECNETFMPPLEGMDPDRRMTTRCVEWIQEQCMRDTFTRLAEYVGCVEGTVRNIAAERFERYNTGFKPYLPVWMGMDETRLNRRMRCVITDVGENQPIDMLVDRDKATITRWLYQFADKSIVKGLAIDMWPAYRNTAQAIFPGLPVVIDKFHVVKMVNKALEDTRIRVQNTRDKAVRVAWKRSRTLLLKRPHTLTEEQRFNLDMWLDNEPEIATAYRLKESFYAFYDAKSHEEGAKLLDEWRASIPADMRKGKKSFLPVFTATRNWRKEILEYFNHPISNGYTEALNGVTKVINRAGRGYSFEVLRAKVLSRNKLLQPAPVAVTTREEIAMAKATMTGHEKLMEALGNRCQACGGIFPGSEIHSHHISAEFTGTRPRRLYICEGCHRRFHTGPLTHGQQPST